MQKRTILTNAKTHPLLVRKYSPILLDLAIIFTLTIALFTPVGFAHAQVDYPVVNALLFYSPTCGHCEKVITEVIPPLFAKFGYQLNILAVDMSTKDGQGLFVSALEYFSVPLESGYVPFLIVGETILVGAGEIPDQFPGVIEQGLQQGGIDWPAIPGLAEVVDYQQAIHNAGGSTSQDTLQSTLAKMAANFKRDQTANTLSVVVLVGLLVSAVGSARMFIKKKTPSAGSQPSWILPILLGIGLIVAAYLTFIEATDTSAVCGPVGDCNAVQQSRYASLFGVIPVGVLGLVGYTLMIAAWIITSYGPLPWQNLGKLAFWLMSLAGTIFSIYLTFLEPFVIGATCAWCLTSAVIMGLLLWLSTPAGVKAYKALAAQAEKQTQEL